MKTTIIYILLFTAFLSTTLQATTTYKTIASDDWNNPTIWSTGGPNACHCVPGDVVDGDNIVLNHFTILTSSITFKGNTKLTINTTESLINVKYKIILVNGNIVSNKYIEITSLQLDRDSKAVFNTDLYLLHGLTNDGLIHLNATMTIEEGDLINYWSNTIVAKHNSHIDINRGNVSNEGVFNLHDAYISIQKKNFINLPSNKTTGPGAITAYDGTIYNQPGAT